MLPELKHALFDPLILKSLKSSKITPSFGGMELQYNFKAIYFFLLKLTRNLKNNTNVLVSGPILAYNLKKRKFLCLKSIPAFL